MKLKTTTMVLGLGLASMSFAAEGPTPISPITNPVYADTAHPESKITVIGAHHRLPSRISTTAGKVPLDGDVNVFAVQVEYAFNDRLSLTSIKDGYTDFNPDNTLSDEEGFNDIALGLKWAFHRGDEWVMAARGTIELSIGDEEVFQGNGDGNFSPALLMTRIDDDSHINITLGAILPFDDAEESAVSYFTYSHARKITEKFAILGELNWIRVLSDGDGTANFGNSQLGSTVPTIVEFEGPDLFNLGSANGTDNPDAVTAALGVRYQVTDTINAGLAYEIPLTDEQDGLTDDRVTFSMTIHY